MEAAGEPIHDTSSKTIPDILESFVVGTEHRKEWIQRSKAVAKPSALGPITGMNFPSTTRRAKQQIEMKREMANSLARENEMDTPETLDSPPMLLPAEKPDYLKIIALGKASGNYASDSKFVGHRLLQSRAYAQMSECNDHFGLQNRKEKEAIREWKMALEMTKARSTNQSPSQNANLTKVPNHNIYCASVTPDEMSPIPRRLYNLRTRNKDLPLPTNLHRPNQQLPTRKVTKPPVKDTRKKLVKCHKVGCTNTNNRNGSRKGFRQVPSYPSPLKSSKPSVVNYWG